MHAPADPGVFALGVFAHDHPIEIAGIAQRAIDSR